MAKAQSFMAKLLKIDIILIVLIFCTGCYGCRTYYSDSSQPQSSQKNDPEEHCSDCGMRGLRVTTFNLYWYPDKTGDQFLEKSKKRKKELSHFIQEEFKNTDVFIFQEVTNKDALNEILPEFECYSYSDDSPVHQFVMICHNKKFQWKQMPPLDISEGKMGMRLVPNGMLVASGKPVAQIFGVHLAAQRSKVDYRLEQFRKLLEQIQSQDTGLPVIVAGDFNLTEGQVEVDRFYTLEGNIKLNIKPVENNVPTFSNLETQGVLDYIWFARIAIASVQVWPSCADKTTHEIYIRKISDHCPLTANFRFL